MGLGVLGRGIGVAKFLAEAGANLLITDLKKAEDLESALVLLKDFSNIKYVLGEHRLEDFVNVDLVIRAANVPLGSPYLQEAKNNQIPVKMDASLFCKLAPPGVKIIGITGTRGKSTVTHLLYEIIKLANTKTDHRVFLGGNVRGLATLPLLAEVKAGDVVVLELDSWQLQGFGEEQISPEVAVFTTFMPDHLNYYEGDMGRYLADKANIFLYQLVDDKLVVGDQVVDKIKNIYGQQIKTEIKVAGVDDAKDFKIKLIGSHNRYNVGIAIETAKLLGVPLEIIKEAVENFSSLPGRLEFVNTKNGVRYYNDTNATTPDAVIAALQSFPKQTEKIILIGGGADKELDYDGYVREVIKRVKHLILFPGLATEKIKKLLPADFNFTLALSMSEAVFVASQKSVAGDIVLLSPGASSFGLPPSGFKNEYDRGDQFKEAVIKL